MAEEIGARPIDFSAGDPVEQITELTRGRGVDRGVEAVGYQAHDHSGEEHPELVLDNLIKVVRTTGGIGVVGVYVPEDPGAKDEQAKQGRIGFDYGTFFTKGQSMGTGQAPVKRYNRQLRDLIMAGRATPFVPRLARAVLGRSSGGLPAFRQSRGRLDQGAAPPRPDPGRRLMGALAEMFSGGVSQSSDRAS